MLRPMSHGRFLSPSVRHGRPLEPAIHRLRGRGFYLDGRVYGSPGQAPGDDELVGNYSAAIARGADWAPRSRRPGRAPVGSPSR